MSKDELKTALIALGKITPALADEEFESIDAELDRRFTSTVLLGDWMVFKYDGKYDLRRL